MIVIQVLAAVVIGYLLGSFPSGLVVVRLMAGKDVRDVGSGRTGGTNAYRAAGPLAGVLTGVLDGLKGGVAVWIATFLTGGNPFVGPEGNNFVAVLAGLAAVVGHIYSMFLTERDENGRLKFRGGAGGAPSVGAAGGLWFPSLAFIVPVGLLMFFGVGYASLTTLSFGLTSLIIFIVRYALGLGPWEHILYGVLVLALQLWALRPNLKRLVDGTERAHAGWAKRRAARLAASGSSEPR